MSSDRPDLVVTYAQALFASDLPTASVVAMSRLCEAAHAAIARCAHRGGCESYVAQEYGDYPDNASRRMSWALDVATRICRANRSDQRAALTEVSPSLRDHSVSSPVLT